MGVIYICVYTHTTSLLFIIIVVCAFVSSFVLMSTICHPSLTECSSFPPLFMLLRAILIPLFCNIFFSFSSSFSRQLGVDEKGRTFDEPTSAQVLSFLVKEGDIIVLASDGLYDNVEEREMLEIIDDGSLSPNQLAEKLAKTAYTRSIDTSQDGPFAKLAKVRLCGCVCCGRRRV